MCILKKITPLLLVLIGLQSFSAELTDTLKKACITQQLKEHKSIKSRALSEEDFDEYCKCEADFILDNGTQGQLSFLNKSLSDNPQWLKQLKSRAFNNCVRQEPKKTT
jgi:hypothetical protein